MARSYFHKVADGFDVAPALAEVERLGTLGEDCGSLIVPLYQHPELVGVGFRNTRYEEAHSLVDQVATVLGASDLHSAVVRLLPPRSKIPRHSDRLTAIKPRRRRYHLALQADEQSWFVIRDERCHFASGELWHVDLLNRPHYVVNDSDRPRVMLMVDVFDGPLDPATIQRTHEDLRRRFGDDWREVVQLAAKFE